MNDEFNLAAEQLTQATSRALPPDAALESETAALRESFLRFGSAVEAAGGDFDEAALAAKLTGVCLAGEIRPAAPPINPDSNWWPLVLTAALAASALVAIVRTVSVWPVAGDAVAVTNAPQQPTPVEAGPLTTAGVSQLAWSDPLDDEIASAQDAVERLHGRAADLDGSLESFGSRLEALAAELASGSL